MPILLPVCAVESLLFAVDMERRWTSEELEGAACEVYNHVFSGQTRDGAHSLSPEDLMTRFRDAFRAHLKDSPARTAVFERLWYEINEEDEKGERVNPDNFKRLVFSFQRTVALLSMPSA